ncbi:MAG: gamma carbonic anhydrase family protein [Bacteroidota bacterium]|nr:gamma carbonic anhydrase family protein [Bacteroidota bacterium]
MIYTYNSRKPKITMPAFIAESAEIIGDIQIDEDASVWFNTVIRGDVNSIKIGKKTNIQDGCVIHVSEQFPTIIGEGVTVGHGVIIHAATVNDYCLIGMGSRILDGAEIGKYSLVAAGSVVLQNVRIPEGVLVAGMPAKILRSLTDDERKALIESANNYVNYAKSFQHLIIERK